MAPMRPVAMKPSHLSMSRGNRGAKTEASFHCDNEDCIPQSWVCDGQLNCFDELRCSSGGKCEKDFSDEKNCTLPYPEHTCKAGQFRCKTGLCIPGSWICDGTEDCSSGFDEENCNKTDTANSTATEAPTSKVAPTPQQGSCSSGYSQCRNDECIPEIWWCDGGKDCKDESDEASCNGTITPIEVSREPWCEEESQFLCDTEDCIPKSWVCDGQLNCFSELGCSSGGKCEKDVSDEKNCTLPYLEHSCEDGQFRCKTGLCLPGSWVCDGTEDCSSGLDEENCKETTQISSTTTTTQAP